METTDAPGGNNGRTKANAKRGLRAAIVNAKHLGGGNGVRQLEIELDPRNPWAIANSYLLHECRSDNLRTLCYWRDGFWRWEAEGGWQPLSEQGLRDGLYPWLAAAKERSRSDDLMPFKANRERVTHVIDALRSASPLAADIEPPCNLVLDPQSGKLFGSKPPTSIFMVPVGNGHLEIGGLVLSPPSPRYFVTHATPIRWMDEPPVPARWLKFLTEDIWPNDGQAVRCLRQWMGYLLSGRTDLHSVLFVIGPKRSGKGTLGAVMSALVGERNVVRPGLSSLGRPFGLEPLVGKTLALVSDARLGDRADRSEIVERILTVSGGDNPAIERKFLPSYLGTLSARLVIMSNEIPPLEDTSGAFASRMLVLRMTESYAGREDGGLKEALMAELPGILRWAIGGLRDLVETGRFASPDSASDIVQVMTDTGSDLKAFVSECCDEGPENSCDPAALRAAYVLWLTDQGSRRHVTNGALGRELRAVCPHVRRVQKRDGVLRHWEYEGIRLNPNKTTHQAPQQSNIPLR